MKDLLIKAENYARQPKLLRWLTRPIKHSIGLSLSKCIYPLTRRATPLRGNTFFGATMRMPIPAGLDVYLTGIKSHDSEIRLTHYILNTLDPGMTALDVGAHIGFYSVLMARCVGSKGRVIGFEPSQNLFPFLEENANAFPQLQIEHLAAGGDNTSAVFYEYAPKYSEFNSLKQTHDIPVRQKREVQLETLDHYCDRSNIAPDLIKIDVEGAELEVLKGARTILANTCPAVIVELRKDDYDVLYAAVVDLMDTLEYRAHVIDHVGSLKAVTDVRAELFSSRLESDNIVFIRT